MSYKLHFLHIPKTAGTSQRSLFFDLYNRKNVFWYGMDTPAIEATFKADEVINSMVVGGHKGISFYPNDTKALFCSFLREPVSRVASLYGYFGRPDFAENAISEKSRSLLQESWIEKGLDPTSLVNTINNCAEFRDEIENHQCSYLSRYGRTFSGVLKTLSEVDSIIGTVDEMGKFNNLISGIFGCGTIPIRIKNSSRVGSINSVMSERGAEELIGELVCEDKALYNYIQNEKGGLYHNIRDTEYVKKCLKPKNTYIEGVISNVLEKIYLYSKGYIYLHSTGFGSTGICFSNKTNYSIGKNMAINEMEITCHAYDLDGGKLDSYVCYLDINRTIYPGDLFEGKINVNISSALINRVKYFDLVLSVPSMPFLQEASLLSNSRVMVFNL
jgi:hypothetical protein